MNFLTVLEIFKGNPILFPMVLQFSFSLVKKHERYHFTFDNFIKITLPHSADKRHVQFHHIHTHTK